MRRVSMATRDELVAAGIERYSKGRRAEKGRILDEFVAITGFHRKHAMRVLRAGSSERRTRSRPERRVYDKAHPGDRRASARAVWHRGLARPDQRRHGCRPGRDRRLAGPPARAGLPADLL